MWDAAIYAPFDLRTCHVCINKLTHAIDHFRLSINHTTIPHICFYNFDNLNTTLCLNLFVYLEIKILQRKKDLYAKFSCMRQFHSLLYITHEFIG